MTTDLVVINPDADDSWRTIVDAITLSLDYEDVPERVIQAMELYPKLVFPEEEHAIHLRVITEKQLW